MSKVSRSKSNEAKAQLPAAKKVAPGAKKPQRGGRPAKAEEVVFQFKITLKDIQPPIWRRIQVRDCSLEQFHELIQVAMGWENAHLYQFYIEGKFYGAPSKNDFGFDADMLDGGKVRLSDLVPKSGKKFRFTYEYDFGDGWLHVIEFEKHPPLEGQAAYPRCLEGERACPPEDCGGPWGYSNLCEALADPKHEQHEEMLEWFDGPLDAEEFDAQEVSAAMWRAGG